MVAQDAAFLSGKVFKLIGSNTPTIEIMQHISPPGRSAGAENDADFYLLSAKARRLRGEKFLTGGGI